MFKTGTNGAFATCSRCRLPRRQPPCCKVNLQRNFKSFRPYQDLPEASTVESRPDDSVHFNVRHVQSKSKKSPIQRVSLSQDESIQQKGKPDTKRGKSATLTSRNHGKLEPASEARKKPRPSSRAREGTREQEIAAETKMRAAQALMKAADAKMKAAEARADAANAGRPANDRNREANHTVDLTEDISDFEPFTTSAWELQPIDQETPPVPRLAHGLERVLFNPGPVQLRDLHSRVYNFDQYLESVTPADQINFETLKGFIPSSDDNRLAKVCIENKKKYCGSTSSLSGVLSTFHFLLSDNRPLSFDHLSSKTSSTLSNQISEVQRLPSSIFLRWRKEGYYAVDADGHDNFSSVLSLMGRYLERFLTVDEAEFALHKKGASGQSESPETESHHYTSVGDVVIRSQLDAYDPRLPGTGVFDLKTRAVLPIRMDPYNYQQGLGYELRQMQGHFSSFEREAADIFRSTLLKYSLQVRMGRMDGIFVAFHNIVRLFGFQYFSLDEMDRVLHGQPDRYLGDSEFLYSVHLLNKVLNLASEKYPEQTLRITMETRRANQQAPQLDAFVEPITEDAVEDIKTSRKLEVERWEKEYLATGKTAHIFDPTTSEPQAHALRFCDNDPDGPVTHISLQTRSDIDGVRVRRPVELQPWQSWNLKYKLRSNDERAKVLPLYRATKKRVRELLDDRSQRRRKFWMRDLIHYIEEGKTWRRDINRNDAMTESQQGGIKMWNSDDPVKRRTPSL